MVMVIKSNVSSNTIANPDGWNPPFNTDGLLYAGIYDRGLSKNFAPNGGDAVVVGSPAVDNHFATLGVNNYIETGLPPTTETTLLAVVKKTIATERQYFISSFNGTSNAGRSVVFDKTTARLAFYSSYRNVDTAANAVQAAATTLSVSGGAPAFVYGRDTGTVLSVGSLTDAKSSSLTPDSTLQTYANPALTYRIGRSFNVDTQVDCSIAAALIFNKALSDTEIKDIYDYFKAYYARRGINI